MGERVPVIDEQELSQRRTNAAVGCGTIVASAFWPIVGDFYALFHLIFGRFPGFPFSQLAFSMWALFGFTTMLDILRVRSVDKFSWSAIWVGLAAQFTLLFPHLFTDAVLDSVMERDNHGGYVFFASIGMGVFCGVWTYYATRYVYQHWCVPPKAAKS